MAFWMSHERISVKLRNRSIFWRISFKNDIIWTISKSKCVFSSGFLNALGFLSFTKRIFFPCQIRFIVTIQPSRVISNVIDLRRKASRNWLVIEKRGVNVFHCVTHELIALNARLKDATHDCMLLTQQVEFVSIWVFHEALGFGRDC